MRKGGNRGLWHILRDYPTLAGGTVGTDDNQGISNPNHEWATSANPHSETPQGRPAME